MKTYTLLLALLVAAPGVVRAQDETVPDGPNDAKKSITGVTPAQADRLFQAITHSSQQAKNYAEGIDARFGWTVSGQQKSSAGWTVHGNIAGSYEVNDRGEHNAVVGWVANVLSPANQKVDFSYDKAVLIEYSAASKKVTATIEEGGEEDGKYNVLITGILDSSVNANVNLPNVNVTSPNFGFSASVERKQARVGVVGLPYVLAPYITLRSEGDGHHLRMEVGMLWKSQASIDELPVQGQTNTIKIGLSLANQSNVVVDTATSNDTFTSTLSAKSDGDGILGSLYYDETEGDPTKKTSVAYNIKLSAKQEWNAVVDKFPMQHIGSAHWEKLFPTMVANLPPPPATGLDESALPPPMTNAMAMAAVTVDPQQQQIQRIVRLYAQQPAAPPPPPPSSTSGLVSELKTAPPPAGKTP